MQHWLSTERRLKRDTEKDNKVQEARDDFDRDYGRVLHCSSFRRLQGKTQLWGVLESDFFRTRLTHSLEAAQIGGAIAKEFGLPRDAVMASCLAHDIGHPPFGHDGASVMKRFAERVTAGSCTFDDNAQTFRVLSRLEGAFGSPFGLNLTCATLDGTLKYKRVARASYEHAGYYPEDEEAYRRVVGATGTGNKRSPLVMFVELADDIAYACHDLEDALRAKFITIDDIEALTAESDEGREALDFIVATYKHQCDEHKTDPERDHIAAKRLKSRLVDKCISLALKCKDEISARLDSLEYDEDLKRNLFFDSSPELKETVALLKTLIRQHVIDAPNIQRLRFASNELLVSYLERYRPLIENGRVKETESAFLSCTRSVRQRVLEASGVDERCRIVLDYVSGMTDRYLMEQASMFFDLRHEHAVALPR